jgi:Rieske Fe-S protein
MSHVHSEPPPVGASGPPTQESRRGFLAWLLGGGVLALSASILYPVIRFIVPPKLAESPEASVIAGKVGDLGPNSGKTFKFGSRPGILLRTPSGEYRAFSALCTHLQCTVQYREDQQSIWCACHNGRFDLAGRNVAGPPPRPLEAYDVAVRGDDIVVSKRS